MILEQVRTILRLSMSPRLKLWSSRPRHRLWSSRMSRMWRRTDRHHTLATRKMLLHHHRYQMSQLHFLVV
jgi:hypothetical protein